MGFLCIDRSLKKDVEQSDLKNQKLVRDIGLDNVYNLNPEINFCSEIFINPSFYMSGTSKLFTGSTTNLTGCTSGTTEIYNLDYTSDFNIYFNITGDTSFTAYTGSFCYKIFTDNNFGSVSSGILNNGSELFNYCISFSSITSTTITKQFLDSDLVDNWGQYLIRPYYTFYSKNCSNKTYNTWDYITQTNGFNNNTDYLFTTVINPPKPNLQPPSEPEKANYTLVTDKLYYDGISGQRGSQAINNTLNYFLLTSVPSNGQILLILNGIQLTQDYDFRLLIQGFGQPPIVEVLNNEIKPTDWLFATYTSGQPPSWVNNLGIYFIDTVVVDSITNVTTPNYRTPGDNTINYNTVNNKYEFFTSLPIDSSYSTIVSVNGVKLAENYQYFLSDSFDGRIIFELSNTEFKIGDVISVLAVSKSKGQDGNNYGSLKETQFNVIWSVPPSFTNNNVTGRFIIRAYDNDTNVLTNQSYIDFIDGQSNYNYLINNLSLNVNYRFEVIFEATYNSLLNNKIITCSSSEGFFDTTSLYLNNKY
jgi:hypothetical protein